MQLHAHTGQERVAPTPGPQRPNQVARGLEADTTAVLKQLKLGIVNMHQPACLHIDTDDTNISGVLVQGEGESYRVCAMVG